MCVIIPKPHAPKYTDFIILLCLTPEEFTCQRESLMRQ